MRIVPINCVVEDTILAKTIMSSAGNILLKKGVKLTKGLIEKIEENGIYTVYVDDGYSDVEIEDVIKPEIRNKAMLALKDTFENIERSNFLSRSEEKGLRKQLDIKVMEKYVEKLKFVTESIIEDITTSNSIVINLVDIKNVENYLYSHSLNVAVLALILGIELKIDKQDLVKLFLGSLIHDVGFAFIKKDIIKKKKEEYTDEDLDIYKSHTIKGYEYIKENFFTSPKINIIALMHHENYDGTGFPKGTKFDHIHKFARIVAIADKYDELTSDTPFKRALPPNDAIEYLMSKAGTDYDFDMVKIFVRKIVPYPVGTLIQLSDNSIAVVEKTNINNPLRPLIRILDLESKDKKSGKKVDLLTTPNITIINVIHKDPMKE
jgi:HD-GYP domain-containing protein (c-di-GMP phosphodiesterase class II)